MTCLLEAGQAKCSAVCMTARYSVWQSWVHAAIARTACFLQGKEAHRKNPDHQRDLKKGVTLLLVDLAVSQGQVKRHQH